MAKDPAVNWYFDNWDGGTKLFTRHQKGCYIDLLSAQFHSGPLSLENIKTVLGADFQASWPVISKKFTESEGVYFNERLESERKKRAAYSESRSKNRQKKDMKNISKTYDEHMNNIPEIGIETGSDFLKGVTGENLFNQMPTDSHEPSTDYYELCCELVLRTKQVKVGIDQIKALWPVFKVQNLTGSKYYADVGAVHSHFMNWIKTQKFELNASREKQSRFEIATGGITDNR